MSSGWQGFSARNIIAGYIARQLETGTYKTIPPLLPIERSDLQLINEFVSWFMDQYEFGNGRRMLQLQRTVHTPGEDMMNSVLGKMRHHSIDDARYMRNPQANMLQTYLPDLDHITRPLLSSPPFQPFSKEDAIALALARWFKNSFMSWIDPIKCPDCGGKTLSAGSVEPTEEERRDSAGRCELHVCEDPVCGGSRRFARFNSVEALLRTKEGRCGEWAQLFYVMLAATGVHARYIWCSEDHVWTEYWSPALKHWVHVDSCEAATNKPLLYARGWGKKQSFILAAGPLGLEDVTKVYVDDWEECKIRRTRIGWNERKLGQTLREQTILLRLAMNENKRKEAERMDQSHAIWLNDEKKRLQEAEEQDLGGRVSGPEEWRARRDEMGSSKVLKPRYTIGKKIISSKEHIQLLGSVQVQPESIRLTSGPSQVSGIFSKIPIQQAKNFRCLVTFKIIAPPGCGEADGMAVVFTPEVKLGLGGYGLGYSGLGSVGDFAVEIDTYRTQDFADDPPTPHISVHSPPDAHHQSAIATAGPDIIPWVTDGWTYTLELLYNGRTRGLKGFLTFSTASGGKSGEDATGSQTKSGTRREVEGEKMEHEPDVGETSGPGVCEKEVALFDTLIPKGNGKEWYVGITAATGGQWQVQDVLEWTLDEIEESE